MRIPFAALLLAAVPLASAQDAPSTPSASGLFGETGVSAGYAGRGVGLLRTTRATVGYRLTNGLQLAITAHERAGGDRFSALSVGPEVGYTRALDPNTTFALRLDGRASFYSGDALVAPGYQMTSLSTLAEGTATRRFRLGRGIDLAATAGLYGAVARTLDVNLASGTTRTWDGDVAEAGAVVGLQAEFDALGGRFAVGPYGGVPVASTQSAVRGVGLYQGRGRGFLTFSF